MINQLIERLVSDLKLQGLLIDSKLWAHCNYMPASIAGAVLFIMGLHADYPNAIKNGTMSGNREYSLPAGLGA